MAHRNQRISLADQDRASLGEKRALTGCRARLFPASVPSLCTNSHKYDANLHKQGKPPADEGLTPVIVSRICWRAPQQEFRVVAVGRGFRRRGMPALKRIVHDQTGSEKCKSTSRHKRPAVASESNPIAARIRNMGSSSCHQG